MPMLNSRQPCGTVAHSTQQHTNAHENSSVMAVVVAKASEKQVLEVSKVRIHGHSVTFIMSPKANF